MESLFEIIQDLVATSIRNEGVLDYFKLKF
jgi:hypothetical protein